MYLCIYHLVACAVGVLLVSTAAQRIDTAHDDCQLQDSSFSVAKDYRIRRRGVQMTVYCTSEITLKKCEGTCQSAVVPSVRDYPGFRKSCRCCRDTSTVRNRITLTNCTANGDIVPNFRRQVTVRMITSCACNQCGD